MMRVASFGILFCEHLLVTVGSNTVLTQAKSMTYTKVFKLKILCKFCYALISCCIFLPVNAQNSGAIQRQLQQQIERSAPPSQIPLKKSEEQVSRDPDEDRIEVVGYKFEGNTLISDEQLSQAVAPWSKTLVSFNDLRKVTNTIQDLYAKNDRLAVATIPPQDVKDGLILITINESRLGELIVEPADSSVNLRISADTAKQYFGQKNDGSQYIDIKSFDRSLAVLNDLPGVAATGQYEAGVKLGQSNLRVKLSDKPFINGQIAFSNYGSASTGVEQIMANLSLNNLSGFGDQVVFDLIESFGSNYGQMGYSLPVGYDGWRLGAQVSSLAYQTLSSFSSTQSVGIASTQGISLTYPLLRQNDHSVNVRFGLDNRGYSNSATGSNVSNYQITALTAGINGTFSEFNRAITSYSVTGSLGNLTINNSAQAIQDSSGPQTAGAYLKLNFNVNRTLELSLIPKALWSVSLYGQIANANLNSAEQIYMGGPFAIRAYPVGQGGGAQGLTLTNELQYRLDENWQLGAFLDVGVLQQYVNTYSNWQGLTNASNTYYLASVGPTIKVAYDNWMLQGTLAFRVGDNPLYNSSGQQLNVDNAYRSAQAWIRASFSF